jgi:hypothetical protein
MTTSPASGPFTFRARRFPIWLCFGIGGFLLLIVAVVSLAAAPGGDVGLAVVLMLIVGAPALFVLKMANDLRRSRIVVTDDGLELRVSRFRIWAIRSPGHARLSWRDVHGVQRYEIPNFAAAGGRQIDYVLHTARGAFAISSVQFAEAERIADLVAARIGRKVGELPAAITPVSVNTPAGRRGVRLMRALGWCAQVAGILFPLLMSLAWLRGDALEPSTIGGVAATSGVLLMLGRSLRRFELK